MEHMAYLAPQTWIWSKQTYINAKIPYPNSRLDKKSTCRTAVKEVHAMQETQLPLISIFSFGLMTDHDTELLRDLRAGVTKLPTCVCLNSLQKCSWHMAKPVDALGKYR